MRIISVVLWAFALVILTDSDTIAQTKTLILVRHAEKDISEAADKSDPELSSEGKLRAERLVQRIKRYKPGAVYSTNYKRTRETAVPMAKRRRLEIQTYDAKKHDQLLEAILKSKTKRFLIVGHSNTIPALANLLVKRELFKNLEDSEYSTIWLIRMKNGVVKKVEILQY